MATQNKLYKILVENARVVNRVSKSAQKDSIVKKMYQIKAESIIGAVEIIEKTKTKSVTYELGFDEEKQMNTISFKFKHQPYMITDTVCFHITKYIYNKVMKIKENYT